MRSHEIAAVWERISNWLVQHAPKVHQNLHSGATEQQLETLEQQLDCIDLLPDDFKELYRIHNGANSCLFRNHEFLTVDEVLDEWKVNKSVLEDQNPNEAYEAAGAEGQDPHPKIQDLWFDTKWIPFTRDGCGNSFCIDLNPGKGGKVGQVIFFDHEGSSHYISESLTRFMEEFADELDAGEYVLTECEEHLNTEKY